MDMIRVGHQPRGPRAVLSAGQRRRRIHHPGRVSFELAVLTALILLALFVAEAKAIWA